MRRFITWMVVVACSAAVTGRADAADVGRLIWRMPTGLEAPGIIVNAAVDDGVWLATRNGLFVVQAQKATLMSQRPHADARLVLAPGGSIYAWLIPDAPNHLLNIELRSTEGRPAVRLEPGPEGGYRSLILGQEGRLIATVVPLRDLEGLRGPFRYTFWSPEGQRQNSVELPDLRAAILDPEGRALLLLGEKSADAFSPTGTRLWSVEGQYRQAAIAQGGAIALLNPAREIDRIVIVRDGQPRKTLKFPTAVHLLTLSPDGAAGAIVGDRGVNAFVNPSSGEMDAPQALPAEGKLSYVFSAAWLNRNTIVYGALHPANDSARSAWNLGSAIAVDRKRMVHFRKSFEIEDATAGAINIQTEFGSPEFVIVTPEATMLGRAQ